MGSCEVGQTALGGGEEPSLWSQALTFTRWSMWPKGTYDMSSEGEGGDICWVVDR